MKATQLGRLKKMQQWVLRRFSVSSKMTKEKREARKSDEIIYLDSQLIYIQTNSHK